MKKIMSLMVSVIMLLSLCPVTAFAAGNGAGSEENPYLVSSEAELNEAIERVNGTNNHIKVTADMALTSYIKIAKPLSLDFGKKTISGGSIEVNNASDVTLKNGVLTNNIHIKDTSDFNLENIKINSTDIYLLDVDNSSGTVYNCYFETSAVYAASFLAIAEYGNEETDDVYAYTVTVTQTDFIAGSRAYVVSNQQKKAVPQPDLDLPLFYYPHAYYHLSLNGTTVSDENSDDILCKENRVIGGYDDSWMDGGRETAVTYQVQPTYTVTIPAKVTLGGTAAVEAENVVVEENKQLTVKITATSEADNRFRVTNGKTAKLDYSVTDGSRTYAIGDPVLSVNPTSAKSGENTLTFTAPQNITYAGTYTGTVTFTVSVEDVA